MLDKSGEFTQNNIQCSKKKIATPLQQVEYFCKDGENRYKTAFAIFGFQYVPGLMAKISEQLGLKNGVKAFRAYSDGYRMTF